MTLGERFTDRMIKSDTYQKFVYDTGFYLLFVVWIVIFSWYVKAKKLQMYHIVYFIFPLLSMLIVLFINYRRDRKNRLFFNFNKGQLLLLVGEIAILLWLFFKYKNSVETVDWFVLTEELMIASWENMAFGIILPFGLLSLIKFGKFTGKKEVIIMFVVLVFCDFAFALAHWLVYAGDFLSIVLLFLMGLPIIACCYAFSPTLSVILHLLNNILLLS